MPLRKIWSLIWVEFMYGISLIFSCQDFLEFFFGAISDQFREFPQLQFCIYASCPRNYTYTSQSNCGNSLNWSLMAPIKEKQTISKKSWDENMRLIPYQKIPVYRDFAKIPYRTVPEWNSSYRWGLPVGTYRWIASFRVELIGIAVLAVSLEQVHRILLSFQNSFQMALLLHCAGNVTLASKSAQSNADLPKAVLYNSENSPTFAAACMVFEQMIGVWWGR